MLLGVVDRVPLDVCDSVTLSDGVLLPDGVADCVALDVSEHAEDGELVWEGVVDVDAVEVSVFDTVAVGVTNGLLDIAAVCSGVKVCEIVGGIVSLGSPVTVGDVVAPVDLRMLITTASSKGNETLS